MAISSTNQDYNNWADNLRIRKLKKHFNITDADDIRDEVDEFISNLNIQEYIKTDYKGRVLLELFQNADDAANLSNDKNKNKIKIISDGRILKILNQGITFTEDTLRCIIYPALSNKKEDDIQTTGSKGIGFRSVLNWSDDIKIYSGDFAVHFSKSKCIEEIQNKYKDTPIYQSMIKNNPDWTDKINFLTYPFTTDFPKEWVSGKGYLYDDNIYYDTCIEIKLNDGAEKDYFSAQNDFLNNHILSMLFFLKIAHICFETIDINTNKKEKTHIEITKTTKKNINDLNYCVATLSQYEEETEKETKFHIFNQDTETIAVPFDFKATNSYKLFATFPIEDQICPFSVIMNGRKFKVTSNRNSFTENEQINFESIRKLQDMLITKIAPYFAEQKFGSQALEMVAYHNIESTIFKNEIENIDKLISDQKIIPTTNEEYHKISDILGEITYADIPNFLINDSDCRFISSETHNLLEFSKNLQQQIQKIKPSILCNFINNKSADWNTEKRMSTLLFWLDSVWINYLPETNILPNLIKTQKNGFYVYSKENVPYFYSGTDVTEIPEWLDLMIIDSDDQKELFRQFKLKHPEEDFSVESTDRVIAHKYEKIKPFWYMDKTRLRTEINSQIKGDFHRAIDSIKFVYANYKNDSKQTADSNEWFIPCANGEVLKSNQTYFGTEYTDNPLISRICQAAKLTPIASPSQFSLSENEIKEFVETIKSRLNIRDNILPKKSGISDSYYKNQAQTQIQQQNPDFKNIYVYSQEGITIPELDNILENATQTDILQWLTKYICPMLSETDQITCNYSKKHKPENTTVLQMQNYIIYKLRNTDWINIDNKKIAPKYCLIQKRNSSYVFPSDLVPVLPQYDTYKNLWDLLKSNQYIHQLPADAFYNILLKLPEIDTQGTLSTYIYSQIAKEANQQDLDILIHSDCKEKKQFFQDGQLWAKNRYDSGKFYPVSDGVYYTSSNVLNIENKPIMATPKRNGKQENFQQIFNVRKFEENIIASYDKSIRHHENDKFRKTFEDFKKILNALNETANLTNSLPNLEISLVSTIYHSTTDEILELKDYEIISTDKQNKYFIKLQHNEQPKDSKIGDIIGEICNKISNSKDISSNISLLYAAKDDEELLKERLKNCGGNTNLLYEYKDMKQLFIDTVLKIRPDTNIEELLQSYPINFNNFTSSENTESIIQILTTLNLDVQDFVNTGFDYINLKIHNKQKLENFIFDNEKNYIIALYEDLLNKPNEQHTFYIKIKEFEDLTKTEEIPNTRDYNPEQLISIPKHIKDTIDIDKIYNENLQAFKLKCNNEDVIGEMLNSPEVKANIVFGNLDQLEKTYNDKIIKNNNSSEAKQESSQTSVMEIHYLSVTDTDTSQHKTHTKKATSTKTRFDKSSMRHKQNAGLSAEYEAYKSLKKKYGENNVKWLSSNAEEYKIISQGQGNDSLGYDMQYKDENDIIKYVEVKNATPETNSSYSFIISANEIQCWETNKDNYEIALVDKKSNSIQILSGDDLEKCLSNAKPETKKCTVPFNITLQTE